jgi:hypothetical protein
VNSDLVVEEEEVKSLGEDVENLVEIFESSSIELLETLELKLVVCTVIVIVDVLDSSTDVNEVETTIDVGITDVVLSDLEMK